ncbi:zinc ribbon domain-containing protein [Natronococcus sp. A-GB7]|uniref:zinc ribbon domain-containing protein n=1 Tax=Natronococcus sp. A-GB7 TaxID=3037649 RepID=UPI00241F3DDC|nr:zinc ribbon domain-containing protein [Natronococcus sp. A-GB7]MDG5818782.1 zinc ribbon domain-containing protein [Natronococcus sp. A-GB7]
MSVHNALQAIGLLALAYVLFWSFVALGPIGWVAFGTLFLVGVVQVSRERRRGGSDGDPDWPNYCTRCGTALEFDADGAEPGESVRYCGECGTPVQAETRNEAASAAVNCADCGAPNDPGRTACTHCGLEL